MTRLTRRLGLAAAAGIVITRLAISWSGGGLGGGETRTVGQYQVRLPDGWTAEDRAGTLHLARGSEAAAAARVAFTTGTPTLAAAARLVGPLAAALGATLPAPFTSLDPTTFVTAGTQHGRTIVGVLSWVASDRGTSMLALALAEPVDADAALHEELGAIVESIRIAPPASATSTQDDERSETPAVPDAEYVRWHDPVERAFSMEVPEGWSARGGMTRMAAVDVRPELRATDPANEVVLMFGDRSLPPFTEPTPLMASLGLNEGAPYSPGYGVTFLIRSYLDGQQFAQAHTRQLVNGVCEGVTIDQTRPRPDLDDAINRSYAQFANLGMAVRRTSGEASFSCDGARGPQRGYVLATTERVEGSAGVAMWTVSALFGFVAPAAREAEGREHLGHLASTWTIDPQWAQAQNNTAVNVSGIVRDTGAAISRIIVEGYEQRQARLDAVAERRAHAFRGTTEVVDPVTGDRRTVENAAEFFWVAPNGTIVGTNVDATPGVEFRKLDKLF